MNPTLAMEYARAQRDALAQLLKDQRGHGLSVSEAAEKFDVCKWTVAKYMRRLVDDGTAVAAGAAAFRRYWHEEFSICATAHEARSKRDGNPVQLVIDVSLAPRAVVRAPSSIFDAARYAWPIR